MKESNIIRRAEISDIDDINRLLYQVNNVHAEKRPDIFIKNQKKYNDEELKKIINDDNSPIFVYCQEGIKGYAFCVAENYTENNNIAPRKTLYIDDICVDEKYRGSHIGSKIYEYVYNYAKAHGFYNITLNVWQCNPQARKFYEKLGFLPYKTAMEQIIKDGE